MPKNIDDGDNTEDKFRRYFIATWLIHEQEQKCKDLK